jgi:hypothetical protein
MKAAGGYPEGEALPGRRWTVALAVLGGECWVLSSVAPRLRHGVLGGTDLLVALMPLLFLLGGAFGGAFGNAGRLRPRWASWALLLGFPVSLAASVAARSDLTEREAWGPLTIAVLAVSFLGFLGTALVHLGRPEALREASPQPLSIEAHQRSSDAFRNGRVVLGLVLVLAVAGLSLLPFWGGRVEAVTRFGAAADDAIVLAVTVAGLLFAIVVGAIVGPALRARKRTDPRRERWTTRAMPFVVAALVAAVLRALLAYIDWLG